MTAKRGKTKTKVRSTSSGKKQGISRTPLKMKMGGRVKKY